MTKDVGMRIRVERDLRAAFNAACERERTTAARELRQFMQTYVERHQDTRRRIWGIFRRETV